MPETGEQRLHTYLGIGGLAAAALLAGAALFPDVVVDRFLWQYFWGPVVADAAGQAVTYNGVTAVPGYTLVSEVGYGVVLAYSLLLLVAFLQRVGVGTERNFVLAFVPFIIGGGLLRVVEDVATAQAGVITAPLRYLLISPVIYGTMFVLVFGVLLLGILLQRRNIVDDYRRVVAGGGTVVAAGIAAWLVQATAVSEGWLLPVSAVIPVGILMAVYGVARIVPSLDRVLSAEGVTVLYGHLLDGTSTALSIAMLGYGEKHPLVDMFIRITGTAYSFIPLKLAVIGGIVYYMNGMEREDDPLFFNLVLLGILAVGFGPGVRNTVRAVLGV